MTCIECGREFPGRKGQRFCSDLCQKRAYRRSPRTQAAARSKRVRPKTGVHWSDAELAEMGPGLRRYIEAQLDSHGFVVAPKKVEFQDLAETA